MLNELIIIVVLIVMGAAIAYLGDWIGFTMGKRRLTLFGLRPRHTARVFTSASGAVIAVVTFLTLIQLVPAVHIAIREGARIIERNRVLSAETYRLQIQSTKAVAAEQKAMDDESAALRARDSAQAQYSADKKALAADKKTLTQDDAAVAQAGVQLGNVRNQLSSAKTSLSAARTALAQAQTKTAELLKKQTEVYEAYVDTNVVPQMKQNAVVYENGQEIGRTVIRSDQKVEDIKQQVRKFLLTLSVDAQSRGAARGSNGRFVEIPRIKLASKFYSEADSVDALAEQISANERSISVVVIAHASGNTFAGEPADITLTPWANHLAVTRGTTLGEITIPETDDTPTKMLGDLLNLLQRARRSAISAGVIPKDDPQTGQREVGEANLADLIPVVDDVKAVKGPATVSAVAARDMYSADSLDLQFIVRSAQAEISAGGGR